MVPSFIMYDKYIENYDRHGNNVCLLPNENLGSKVDYYLFDHDLAFQRMPGTSRDIRDLRGVERKLEHMVFLVSFITELRHFDGIINRLESLSQKIPDIIKIMPHTWSSKETEYVNSIEILLTKFTKDIARKHLLQNKDRLTSMNWN